jgi:hypothetical protein
MDENYIYWIRDKDPGNMFRMPLKGGDPTKVITSKYDKGSIFFFGPISTDKWLIFGDTPNARGVKINWLIRAVNKDDFSERIILQSTANDDSITSFSMDVDRDFLIWSYGAMKSGKLVEDTVSVMNLNNGQTSEVIRSEGDVAIWSMVKISKDGAVAEQDLFNTTGADNNIYYFDLLTKQSQPLTTDGQSSMPGFSYPWIIWKSAPRFEFAEKITLYNLESKEKWLIPLPSVDNIDPLINGNFVYWSGNPRGNDTSYTVYILNTIKKLIYVLPPAENRNVSSVAIHGQIIAWLRIENFQRIDSDAYLEWGTLDNSIN